jgi:hypothetical protein
MTYLIAALLLVAIVAFGFRLYAQLNLLHAAASRPVPQNLAGRYRPMLRLLSDADLKFGARKSGKDDAASLKALRAERRQILRSYLACLSKDYASLLAAVRNVMVQSGVDRPDLARALAKNRMLFALAMCKIEFRLAMHWAGAENVEISGLVGAFDALREQVAGFSAMPTLA